MIGSTSWEELSLLPKGIHCVQKRKQLFNRSNPPSRESIYFWKWTCRTRIGTYFKLFIVLLRCSGRSSRILTAQAFPQAEELRVIPLENLVRLLK